MVLVGFIIAYAIFVFIPVEFEEREHVTIQPLEEHGGNYYFYSEQGEHNIIKTIKYYSNGNLLTTEYGSVWEFKTGSPKVEIYERNGYKFGFLMGKSVRYVFYTPQCL